MRFGLASVRFVPQPARAALRRPPGLQEKEETTHLICVEHVVSPVGFSVRLMREREPRPESFGPWESCSKTAPQPFFSWC